jgi:hypothetical protein
MCACVCVCMYYVRICTVYVYYMYYMYMYVLYSVYMYVLYICMPSMFLTGQEGGGAASDVGSVGSVPAGGVADAGRYTVAVVGKVV